MVLMRLIFDWPDFRTIQITPFSSWISDNPKPNKSVRIHEKVQFGSHVYWEYIGQNTDLINEIHAVEEEVFIRIRLYGCGFQIRLWHEAFVI